MSNWTKEAAEQAQEKIDLSKAKAIRVKSANEQGYQDFLVVPSANKDKLGSMINTLESAANNLERFADRIEFRSKRGNPKTATTVGAKPERDMGATMAQPHRKKNPEYNIQKNYVQEMARRYPHILIFSDAAAHVAKSMIQQVRANALQSKGQKQPDTFVAQPSGDYAGLFLEFKAETPYKVDGVTLKKSDHVEAQARTMQELTCRGYICSFVWSVEIALDVTERYLNGQL